MPFEMVLNALHNAYSWNFADHGVSQKLTVPHVGGLSGGAVVKNPPANAGDIRHVGLIPGLGRSPAGGHAVHSSILAWRIPWTEEPDGLESMGSHRVGHN